MVGPDQGITPRNIPRIPTAIRDLMNYVQQDDKPFVRLSKKVCLTQGSHRNVLEATVIAAAIEGTSNGANVLHISEETLPSR